LASIAQDFAKTSGIAATLLPRLPNKASCTRPYLERKMNRFLISLVALSALAAPAMAASLKIDTSKNCSFTIEMMPEVAPKHVAQISKLAASGFYN
jgi:hypothetical protein